MRALRFPEAFQAEVVTLGRPGIRGARELEVKVEACGICASDVAAYKGEHPYRKPPVITGHECAGTVVDVGAGVREFAVGDRVAIEPHLGCGDCRYCELGEYQQCVSKTVLGVGDWFGGFAEYIVVGEAMCYKLPDQMSFELGALLEPYNVGVHAVRRAQFGSGQSVGIVGAGTIGLATLIAATRESCGEITAVDISEEKLDLALELGASHGHNPNQGVVPDEVHAYAPHGLDVVFATVPSKEGIDLALELCSRLGRVILIATLGKPVEIDTHKIQQYERTVIGTAMYNRRDWLTSLEHLTNGAISTGLLRLISKRVSLDEAAREIDDLARGRSPGSIKTMITTFGGNG